MSDVAQRLFHPDDGATLVRAPAAGDGHWAGAPSRADWRGIHLLTYRLRAPRPRRGYELRVARLDDDAVTDLCAIEAPSMSTASLERAALIANGDQLALYISLVDPADSRWRIEVLRASDPAAFNKSEREPVLDAAGTGTEGVKDPVIVREPGGLQMFASVASERATDADHSSGDTFSTPTVVSATGLARSDDGGDWRWQGIVLMPTPGRWDAFESRISCVLTDDLALYDGIARPEDNYRERTGIAQRGAHGTWRSVTPDGPVLRARYVCFDGERFFWEHELADGSHELRAGYPS